MNDTQNLQLAYTIIQTLLRANESLNDLLATISHTMDEETIRAVTKTEEWENYMETKRELESAHIQVKKLVEQMDEIEIAVEEG